MLRTLTIAALAVVMTQSADAGTGVYKCAPKQIFEVGHNGLPGKPWTGEQLPELILFDVRSGLLTRKHKLGKTFRDEFTVIGRPQVVKSMLLKQPVRSDVTTYKAIIPPKGSNFSSVVWTFTIQFGGPGGTGKFLLVVRQTVTTGTCSEL